MIGLQNDVGREVFYTHPKLGFKEGYDILFGSAPAVKGGIVNPKIEYEEDAHQNKRGEFIDFLVVLWQLTETSSPAFLEARVTF